MNELFLCTPGSIGSIVCLRQSSTMGALPPTPRSFPHWANGLFAKSVAAQGKPCRNTEVSAPLATSTAPVALRQSRILRTMPYSHLKSPQHQSFRVRSCRNPVLLRLRCLVLNRLCLVLLRPRHFFISTERLFLFFRSNNFQLRTESPSPSGYNGSHSEVICACSRWRKNKTATQRSRFDDGR